MELRQLEYLVAVAEEASFTRAAARSHVAQPGVSAQVRRLEEELGQPLFDRSGRRVRLTDAGRAVLPYARAALAAAGGVRQAVDELTGLVRGRVAVGTVTSFSSDVPDLLASFHRDHAGVRITLSEAPSDELLASVAAGDLDLALAALPAAPPAGLAAEVVIEEDYVAAVAAGDPLAAHASTRLTALRGRDLISLPRGTGQRAALERACAAAGFAPSIALEAGDPYVLAQLAARGLGVAIVPSSLAAAHPDEVRAVALRPALRGRLALVWRDEGMLGPAARALVDHARGALRR